MIAHWREPRNDAPFCAREPKGRAGGAHCLRGEAPSLRDCPPELASDWAQWRERRGRAKSARSL